MSVSGAECGIVCIECVGVWCMRILIGKCERLCGVGLSVSLHVGRW